MIAALSILGVVAPPGLGTASAAPTFHDRFQFTEPNVEICGFEGTLRVNGSQVVTFTENSIKISGQVTQVFTTATGERVTIKQAGQFTSQATDNGDGTLTFVDVYKGLPERISSRGSGGVVLRDAGLIRFTTTVNLVTGEFTTDVDVRGPHPEARSDFTLFCTAFTAALN